MLIDQFMSKYDVMQHHEITVHAPVQRVYEAIHTTDLLGSPITRALFLLRNLPARLSARYERRQQVAVTIDVLLNRGFILLVAEPPHEIVLGLVENFWAPVTETKHLDASGFQEFDTPGYAKAVFNFFVREHNEGASRVGSQTRVLCLDTASRRRFRLYWLFIGPFSGLIRQQMLRAIKRKAERG